jgi:hypothetical protein
MFTPPVETRLLGLTPTQYHQTVDQAKREALRLRREAPREWASSVSAWFRSVLHRPSHRPLQA